MEGALEFNFGRGHNRNAINFIKVVRCYSDDFFFVFHFVLVSAFRWIFKIEKNYRDITNVKRILSRFLELGERKRPSCLYPSQSRHRSIRQATVATRTELTGFGRILRVNSAGNARFP